ncbi:MAG: hypothetical protein AB2805_10035, partial [Candidatus Thiodiazotropha sp.]
ARTSARCERSTSALSCIPNRSSKFMDSSTALFASGDAGSVPNLQTAVYLMRLPALQAWPIDAT